MKRALLTLAAVVVLTGLAASQDPLPVDPPSPEDRLVAAVEKLEGRAFAVRGTASSPEQALGPGGGMVVFNQAAGMAPAFEGVFELWTDGKGTVLAASERALPGFECWRYRRQRIDRLTVGDEKFSVDRLMNDVPALCDMGNLRRFVRQTNFRTRRDSVTGETSLTGDLDPVIIPEGAGGVMGILRPKILRVDATFTLDAMGKLLGARFNVVRSDPLAGVMQGGGVRLGPGGNLAGPGGGPLPQAEGESCTYDLDFRTREPGPRIVSFKQVVDKLRGEGK